MDPHQSMREQSRRDQRARELALQSLRRRHDDLQRHIEWVWSVYHGPRWGSSGYCGGGCRLGILFIVGIVLWIIFIESARLFFRAILPLIQYIMVKFML
jgi:hypothetical protein